MPYTTNHLVSNTKGVKRKRSTMLEVELIPSGDVSESLNNEWSNFKKGTQMEEPLKIAKDLERLKKTTIS